MRPHARSWRPYLSRGLRRKRRLPTRRLLSWTLRRMHWCDGRVRKSDAPREFLPYCSYRSRGRERMKKFTSKVLWYEAALPLVLLTLGLYSVAAVMFSVISGFPFL